MLRESTRIIDTHSNLEKPNKVCLHYQSVSVPVYACNTTNSDLTDMMSHYNYSINPAFQISKYHMHDHLLSVSEKCVPVLEWSQLNCVISVFH